MLYHITGYGSILWNTTPPRQERAMCDFVLEELRGDLLLVTLNRPDRLNAVSPRLYEELDRILASLHRRRGIRAVVITGAGRAFCVGADLKAHASGSPTDQERHRYILLAQRVNLRIQRAPCPVVAAVNGHAIGAGLELALSADFLVVAREARLRLPEVALGTLFGGGVSYTLPPRVGLVRAREILLLAREFTGAEALEMGLASRVTPADEVLEVSLGLATELAAMAPLSLQAARRLLREAPDRSPAATLRAEGEALFRIMQTDDWQEGVEAFRTRRTPYYRGE
jgi:enoyl-CoA hydratase